MLAVYIVFLSSGILICKWHVTHCDAHIAFLLTDALTFQQISGHIRVFSPKIVRVTDPHYRNLFASRKVTLFHIRWFHCCCYRAMSRLARRLYGLLPVSPHPLVRFHSWLPSRPASLAHLPSPVSIVWIAHFPWPSLPMTELLFARFVACAFCWLFLLRFRPIGPMLGLASLLTLY